MNPGQLHGATAGAADVPRAAFPMLAIETSQRGGGVAVACADGRLLAEERTESAPEELMATIDRLMRRAELVPPALRSIAVSIGPGGFTGLRVAISTAKMLAESLGTSLVGVPSALVAAANLTGSAGDTALVLLATKRARGADRSDSAATTWATILVWSADDPVGWRLDRHEHGGGRLLQVSSLPLATTRFVVGERSLLPSAAEASELAGVGWREPTFDPLACLAAATRWLAEHGAIDPLRLVPLYPREPEAVALWRERHGGGS